MENVGERSGHVFANVAIGLEIASLKFLVVKLRSVETCSMLS